VCVVCCTYAVVRGGKEEGERERGECWSWKLESGGEGDLVRHRGVGQHANLRSSRGAHEEGTVGGEEGTVGGESRPPAGERREKCEMRGETRPAAARASGE
jgi:hypothetical protein